ncbi:MAG: primase [Thermomicrobiales bacterium]|jgi:hypothetical protein|nr:primase [Thermomicrobiales bacterium]
MFADSPIEEVQAAFGTARWLLDDGHQHLDHMPNVLVDVEQAIANEAARELASRRARQHTDQVNADLDLIKHRLGLPGFIQHRAPFVNLTRQSGGRLLCRCPLGTHEDKTPSFTIYPEPDPHFYCFGCRLGGSVIDFELHWTHDDLRTVIARLAWEAGIGANPDAPKVRSNPPVTLVTVASRSEPVRRGSTPVSETISVGGVDVAIRGRRR